VDFHGVSRRTEGGRQRTGQATRLARAAVMLNHLFEVVAGVILAIRIFPGAGGSKDADARDKRGHDGA
jgi:hypothetical protein